jgi:hypothetical protein
MPDASLRDNADHVAELTTSLSTFGAGGKAQHPSRGEWSFGCVAL